MTIRFADRYTGSMNEEDIANLPPSLRDKVKTASEKRAKCMAPPGALGLPPLLEQRRLEFGITDGAFAFQPMHDKILIHQVQAKAATWDDGGLIEKVDTTRDRELKTCPVGIVVMAGLRALDVLRANGMDLGHLVLFQRLAPWRHETEMRGDYEVLIMRVGDIVGSVDLADALRGGEMNTKFLPKSYEHVYKDPQTDQMWRPGTAEPYISGDQ